MAKKKSSPVRLNIYVHDPNIRRQVKEMTIKKDISISDYCLRAIKTQLIKEQKADHEEGNLLKKAVKKAQRFQETFGGRTFAISSANLIRETREDRNAK
jgi:hypothetical protein